MSKLSYLLTLTPMETWRLVRRRLPVLRDGPAWTANELLSSAKHGRGIRFAELLLRQQAIINRHMGWSDLDFEGRRVVEIGCGPLGGYGPLAIFCGAAQFESAEPEWDAGLFFERQVEEKYLRVLHADLSSLYGSRMDFRTFRRLLEQRMFIVRTGFEDAPINGKVDIVISQSCLEHVFPIKATIEKLVAIQSERTRFLHLVDFGNHYPTADPFAGLYEQPPELYIARRGQAINLLRASDIGSLFQGRGLSAVNVPSRILSEGYQGNIHPWWRERYSDEDLFTQLVLVAGPMP